MSLSVPPSRLSLPVPPRRVSKPAPPRRVSLPPVPPLRISFPANPERLLLPVLPVIVSLLTVPITLAKLTTPKEIVGGVAMPVLTNRDWAVKSALIVALAPKVVAVEASIILAWPVAPIMRSMLTSWSVPAVPLVTTPVGLRVMAWPRLL